MIENGPVNITTETSEKSRSGLEFTEKKEVLDAETVKELETAQREVDAQAIAEIQDFLIEIPEEIEPSVEQANEYKDKYLAEFGRKEPVPTEQEQILALQQFVDKNKIQQYKETLIDAVKKPSKLMAKLKGIFFFREKRRVLEEIDRELALERKMVEVGDERIPVVIGERIFERMHGVDRGDYIHASDQFGREYFKGPDTSTYRLKKYANTLAQYFNVNKVITVKYPLALKGAAHTYQSELETTFVEQGMIVKLAESSRLVDSEKMTPEDCDKIDPMPVTDPDRSLLSGMAINLLTGANDRIIKNDTNHPSKNYIIRKDGTCYLLDLEEAYYKNEMLVLKQMEELNNFLEERPDQKKMLVDYMAKTTIFLGCLSTTDDMYTVLEDHYAKFPKRFYDDIEDSQQLNEENRKMLLEALRNEIKKVTSA